MKPLAHGFRVLLLLALSHALPVQAADSAFPDVQRILDAGTIRVAMLSQNSAPMIMTGSDGSPAGAEADLARDLAKKLGVEVEIIRTAETYDGVVALVADKEADLGVSFLSSGVDRALHVLFSRPYIRQSGRVFYNRTAFARLRRDYDIETLREIDGTAAVDTVQIGVLEGSVYERLLHRDFADYHVKLYASLAELMQAVRNGDIFGGVHGSLQIDFYMRQHPSTAIHVAVDPELRHPSDICIAVRPDAPNLLRWVDVYLANNVGLKDAKELVELYVEQSEAQKTQQKAEEHAPQPEQEPHRPEQVPSDMGAPSPD